MIKEAYCSFEVAKLLKEKGFGGGCLSMYVTPKHRSGMGNPNEAKIAPHGRDSHYYEGYLYQCEAPTHQMAMKWLREVHNLWCEISPEGNGLWYREVYSLIDEEYIPNSNAHKIKSYEEAVEAALKYTLENLI